MFLILLSEIVFFANFACDKARWFSPSLPPKKKTFAGGKLSCLKQIVKFLRVLLKTNQNNFTFLRLLLAINQDECIFLQLLLTINRDNCSFFSNTLIRIATPGLWRYPVENQRKWLLVLIHVNAFKWKNIEPYPSIDNCWIIFLLLVSKMVINLTKNTIKSTVRPWAVTSLKEKSRSIFIRKL